MFVSYVEHELANLKEQQRQRFRHKAARVIKVESQKIECGVVQFTVEFQSHAQYQHDSPKYEQHEQCEHVFSISIK